MPGGDGTGPTGGGTGRRGGGGRGIGRMGGNRPGAGAGGYCVCPSCGTRIPHKIGIPCYEETCPKCRTKMVRE
ncbi:hypothetical protein KAX02_11665 [candidate division WOR-3 bacterium]|nr:hypothetical protein [candidate division WOR-3 bacterium]